MRIRLALVIALCSMPLLSTSLAGEPSFRPFSPLNLKQLHEKRLRFKGGEPRILVGIMTGQESLKIGGGGPLRLMFDERGIPKTLYANAGSKYTFRVLKSQKAKIKHWVVVASTSAAFEEFPSELKKNWTKKGYRTRVFETGTLFAVKGSVLDTRKWLVGLGGFQTEAEAEALITKLAVGRSEADSLFLYQELVEPPTGVIGIYDGRGRLKHKARGSAYVGTTTDGKIPVKGVEYGRGYRWHNRADRSYREHLYVAVDRDGALALVNSISAEKLLAGLVPAEIFATAHIEALKAQAVTARGEIFSKLAHRHFEHPFHLCSEQHCQVYAGAQSEQASTNRAVKNTRGLLAARPRNNSRDPIQIVDTRYSSSSGGFSEANEVVWGTNPAPSLRPRLDGSPNDPALSPFKDGLTEKNIRQFLEAYPPTWSARASLVNEKKYRWTKTISATIADELVAHLGVGRLKDLEIIGRGDGGRVTGVRVIGSRGKKLVLRELPVRRLFGNLNSGMFVVDIERSPRGQLREITFTGGGWGHGVGMCQMGAIGRAESGQTFEQILSHYYSGAVTVGIY